MSGISTGSACTAHGDIVRVRILRKSYCCTVLFAHVVNKCENCVVFDHWFGDVVAGDNVTDMAQGLGLWTLMSVRFQLCLSMHCARWLRTLSAHAVPIV